MATCGCKSQQYGYKTLYKTRREAYAACQEYRRTHRNTDRDWRSMKSYRCPEGNGFHTGHRAFRRPCQHRGRLETESRSGRVHGLQRRLNTQYVCFCGKVRNTLRSLQSHINQNGRRQPGAPPADTIRNVRRVG